MKVTARRILKPIFIGLSLDICAVLILIQSDPKSTTPVARFTEITTRLDSDVNCSDCLRPNSNTRQAAQQYLKRYQP